VKLGKQKIPSSGKGGERIVNLGRKKCRAAMAGESGRMVFLSSKRKEKNRLAPTGVGEREKNGNGEVGKKSVKSSRGNHRKEHQENVREGKEDVCKQTEKTRKPVWGGVQTKLATPELITTGKYAREKGRVNQG